MLSAGLVAFFEKDLAAVVELVRAFDDFSEDNDPYGEHDFGAFEYQGQTINWKIDYYALDMPHDRRLGAIVAGICFAFAASTFFLPIDRYALELSRRLRKRMSAGAEQPLRVVGAMAAE